MKNKTVLHFSATDMLFAMLINSQQEIESKLGNNNKTQRAWHAV